MEVSKIRNMRNHFVLMMRLINSVKQLKILTIKNKFQKEKREKIKLKIKKLRKKILGLKNSEFLYESFIIFNKDHISRNIKTHRWKRFYKKYFLNQLYITQAMEPMDVIWENFGDSEQKRLIKIIFSYIAAIIILFSKS
jgi:hypothetical protein